MAIMKATLDKFNSTRLDFVDCELFARNIVDGEKIYTFDKKLNNAIIKRDG